AVDGEAFDMRRQRDRSANPGTCALGRVDDLLRAVVEHAVIIGLEPDADILVVHRLVRVPRKRHRRPTLPWGAGAALIRYAVMLATTPAPTVRPPSRIAKRS